MGLLWLKAPLRIKPCLELHFWKNADRAQHLHYSSVANLHWGQTSERAFNYYIGHALSATIQKTQLQPRDWSWRQEVGDFRIRQRTERPWGRNTHASARTLGKQPKKRVKKLIRKSREKGGKKAWDLLFRSKPLLRESQGRSGGGRDLWGSPGPPEPAAQHPVRAVF